MGWQERSYTSTGPCSVSCNNRPHTGGKSCNNNEFWNKYSKHIFVSALVGMIVIPMLNNMFQTFNQLTTDVEQLKKDSKITKMKIQSIDNTLSTIKSGSFNIKSMVIDEMEKLNSDKTGKTDYALESTGGSIVKLLPETENYSKPKNLFGLTLCEGSNGPRAMLQIGTAPGQCWAFKGSSGGAIIKLVGVVDIESISLEHIPRKMSPTGEISTAPKDFAVIALRSPNDSQGSYLGQFKYDVDGPALQTFKVECGYPVEFISFKVLSNHGHMDFTCVYRLRVHGSLSKTTHKN
ncbi:unnamed protein product [Brassicogethes aeneus]|uniref:SUN domain-containing protein n=1 Tax=Brassicogethes aeneus TaxID=1431903 RepID=A0A9P0BIC5_BRAAE|nr:unnamed protein product [Brassicogethes aeneus]